MNAPMLASLPRLATPLGALAAWVALGWITWAGGEQEPRSATAGNEMAELKLANAGMEQGDGMPLGWQKGAAVPGVEYTWDKAVGHGSRSSLCLAKSVDRYFLIAQWHQFVPNPAATSKLRVSAWIKAEKVTKGIVDVQFVGQDGTLTHQWVAYIGTKNSIEPPVSHDWTEYAGVAEIPAGTARIGVALQMYGPGKIWFDDVRAGFVADQTPKTDAWQAAGTVPGKPAKPIDREAWARALAGLKEGNWSTAFGIGLELADLPPDEGFAILKANWERIGQVEARQQILKAWYAQMPYPLHARNHPRLLDVLDLGMRDPSPKVREWAQLYLREVAFQDFSADFQAYKAWHAANRGKPMAQVIADSARRVVTEAANAEGREAQKRLGLLAVNTLRDVPEARKAALDAGILTILERRAAAGADRKASRDSVELAAQALSVLAYLNASEADLRRIVVPLLAKDVPFQVRTAAVEALKRKEFPWAVDLLIDVLKRTLQGDWLVGADPVPPASFRFARVSMALGEIGDPRAIPTMIAVIDADNTQDTIYGVGWWGLHRLTGVPYDEAHNGAWWREWWEKNNERYPAAVREIKIPNLPKTAKSKVQTNVRSEDPLADVADVPAQDLRAGGDAKKRYFLVGAIEAANAPTNGYGLLIVLPGGDASADFHPFVRRIYKNVLSKHWLIAQLVAPKWDENQFNRVVWPTEGLRYPAAKFTTEEFVQAIIADVRAKVKVDPKRVFMFGWSSGGPPCYATALRKGTPVAGAFIAMSVFKPEQMPALESAKGKAFYLLQSPEDEVTPMRFAEAAQKALLAANAQVRLKRYGGGHGWRGNVWEMIDDGIAWLDK